MIGPRRSSRLIFLLWIAGLIFIHRYLLFGTVEVGRDLFRLFIPEAAYLRERLLKGEIPLWNPHVRLGQPFAATLTSEVFYPPHVLLVLLFGPLWGIQASLIFHAGLASAGAYFASRRLGAGRWGGVLAGAFGFTPLCAKLAGSLHMLSAMAWSGWIVVAALNLARRPSLKNAAWLGLLMGLSFHCGAPEVVLWQSALALGFALTSRQRLRAVLFTALAGGWCFALSAIAVFPAAELWRASVVPGGQLEDRYDWSTAPAQLLSMFWPFADEKRAPDIFGRDQWLAISLFVGSIPGLLAVLALRRNRKIAVLAIVGLICALLCLGRHFFLSKLLLSLPPFSGFRHPVKYAFGLSFCIALLSGQGLRRVAVWARADLPLVRRVGLGLGAVALIPLLQVLAGLAPWREGMKAGALWFGVAVLLSVLVFAVFSGPGSDGRRVRIALLVLGLGEVAVSEAMIGSVALVAPKRLLEPGVLAAKIRAEPHGRASIFMEVAESQMEAAPNVKKAPAIEFIADSRDTLIGLRPMEEGLRMVEGYGFRDPWRLRMALEDDPRGPYDVFGVTHYVRHGPAPFADLTRVGSAGSGDWATAYRSTTAFPRAWIVHQATVTKALEALSVLREHPEQLRTKVLLSEGEPLDEPPCESHLSIEERSDEALVMHADACAKGYLVVADSYYPGWVATVDGQPARIIRGDFLLEVVGVPKGPSEVLLEYRPLSFRVGMIVTVVALFSVLAVLIPKNRPKFLKPQRPALSSR